MIGVERYTATARWLHWIIAALVLTMICLGLWIVYMNPSEELSDRLDFLHQNIGVLVLLLMLLRLVVRLRNGAPPLPTDTPPLIRFAAGANHFLFYVLVIAQPIVGFLDTNANGFPLTWLGVVPLPSPIGKSDPAAHVLDNLHWYIAAALVLLIAAHVLGVLYHTFIRRDRLLRRMI